MLVIFWICFMLWDIMIIVIFCVFFSFISVFFMFCVDIGFNVFVGLFNNIILRKLNKFGIN